MPLGICNKKNKVVKKNTVVKKNKVVKKQKRVANKENNPNKPIFTCDGCTKLYNLKHSLARHRRFECGVEPRYPCTLCPKKFKHKYDLKVHMQGRHNPLKPPTVRRPRKPKQPKPSKEPQPMFIGHMIV